MYDQNDIYSIEQLINTYSERIDFLKNQKKSVIDIIRRLGLNLSDFETELNSLTKKITILEMYNLNLKERYFEIRKKKVKHS